MNSPGHLLDFRRSYSNLTKIRSSVFIPSEIYIQRVKCDLSKKMKSDWTEVLSVDYLNSINCGAKLEELQKVIPNRSKKYMHHHHLHLLQRTIYHLQRRSSLLLYSYGKSFTPYGIPIFDSADGRIDRRKWNHQSNYLQNKRKVWISFVNIFK